MPRRRRGEEPVSPGRQPEQTPRSMLDALASLLPDGSALAAVASLFGTMLPISEEELNRRWARREHEPQDIGNILCPTRPVRSSPELYRAHCRELISRVPLGLVSKTPGERPVMSRVTLRALSLITRAELLGVMSEASLRHPLGHSDMVMMETLLRQVLPDAAMKLGEPTPTSENLRKEIERDTAERLGATSPERARLA